MKTATANYIAELSSCKLGLADALRAKGADVSTDDSFSRLVERVEALHTGVTYGACTVLSSGNEITLDNIPFVPNRIGIASKELIKENPVSSTPYIVMCCYDKANGTVYDNSGSERNEELSIVVAERRDDGKTVYDIKITAPDTVVFKAYYEYAWVACSEGFEFI